MRPRFKMILATVIGLSLAGIQAQAAEVKVGTVDMQKALQTVEAGRKAKSNLEKVFNKKKAELQKEEAQLKKMHETFQKQSLAMNEKTRMQKQQELQQRFLALQEKTARSQMELQKKEAEMTKPIIERLRGLIEKLAKKKGYSVVLEKKESAVLYSLPKDDLTEQVIKDYNKKFKG